MSGLGKKALDDIIQDIIVSDYPSGQQVDYVGILFRKQGLESSLGRWRRSGKLAVQIPDEQHIEFPHAATAAPAQP
ncbi:MAG: hypothetical protein ABIX37_09445 [Gammaproteobacteria bacterium]